MRIQNMTRMGLPAGRRIDPLTAIRRKINEATKRVHDQIKNR